MSGKQNKCCCSQPDYFLYVGAFSSSTGSGDSVFKINPDTGAASLFRSGLTTVESITVDPTTGYVYTLSAGNTITCSDINGNTIWTAASAGAGGIAVSLDGYVYSPFGFSLRKFNKLTGAEITTGGWPYSPVGPQMGFWSAAVDQSGNVYAGGRSNNTPTTIRGLSLTSAATLRWTTPLRNTLAAADTNFIGRTNVAVNADGTECMFTRITNANTEPTVHSHYEVSSATGGTVASTKLSGAATGIQNGLFGAAYGPLGDSYGCVTPSDSSGHVLVKNASSVGYFVGTDVGLIGGIAVGRDGQEFYTQVKGGIAPFIYNVGSILGGWRTTLASQTFTNAIATSDGLIGAFGL